MSIYLSPRQFPTRLSITNPQISIPINGWQARAALVDNYSNQYVYLPGAPKFVDPQMRHAIVPLPAVGILTAQFQNPPGINTPTISNSDTANILFMETDQPISSGIVFGNNLPILDTFTLTHNFGVVHPHIPIPAGILGLLIFAIPQNTTQQEKVTIVGDMTGFTYPQFSASYNLPWPTFVPIIAIDQTVTITYQADTTIDTTFWILATNTALGVPVVPPLQPQGGSPQIPNAINVTMAANATALIQAGVVGHNIFLYNCSLNFDATVAAGEISLQNTNSDPWHYFATSTLTPNPFIGRGVTSGNTTGLGIQLQNFSSGSMTARGSVTYNQRAQNMFN